ncbi:MAG: TIGR02757 family protein [Chitinispirillales bacterium]|nr:TIGR02757 family protein [Chitinispirillales bacterium]
MDRQLKRTLENIYKEYHHPRYLGLDPLVCVHKFRTREEREITGLLASSLAYGRVEIIVRNIETALSLMRAEPLEFVMDIPYREKLNRFDKFKHRFNDGQDVCALLEAAASVRREYGSLEKCFMECTRLSNDGFKGAVELFTCTLKERGKAVCGQRRSFEYLLPSPKLGSACKRIVMYLRWMIRKDDGIDLGVWQNIPASSLIMPVDTHVAKIAYGYGFTKRNSADWKMAEEITACLRVFDPDDPVRYDFSICRAGMIDFRKTAASS